MATNNKNQIIIDNFIESIESNKFAQIKHSVNNVMQPVDLARILQNTPSKQRDVIWNLINKNNRIEILPFLTEEMASHYMQHMDTSDLLQSLRLVDDDDMADLANNLPNSLLEQVMNKMTNQDKHRLENMMAWSEDSAGGLMNTDMISISADISLDVVWRYLRRMNGIRADTNILFVVNSDNQLIGLLPLVDMLTNKPTCLVHAIMKKPKHIFTTDQSDSEVAHAFEKYDLLSAPVIDANNVPLGRITIDDVVDIIREEAEHSVRSMAGLADNESLFGPIAKSISGRALWLGINLITALIASVVISRFETAIDKIVILAVLMPIVASMGGVATTQSFTLVVRAMALGAVSRKHIKILLMRELSIGLSNGIIWAVILGAIIIAWHSNTEVALIMAFALTVTLMIACVAGSLMPFILKALHIDPALAGGVILTTITDVFGYITFLGTASILLL